MVNTEKLVETYEAKDVFSEFYDRVKEISEEYEAKEKKRVNSFTGEEGFGKYLDLHDMYNQYINSKFGGDDEKIEYSAYLDVFSQPPCNKQKFSKQYRKYMKHLLDYLIGFFKRTKPMQDLDTILSNVEIGFEEQENQVIQSHAVIDLDDYSTMEALIDLGAEKLKEALDALGLKVGGTMQQRAERLFLTKHTPLENIDKKHFAKDKSESVKEIAIIEAKVKKLCDLLDETIQRTKQNVEKKQAWTYKEMEQERKWEEEEEEDNEEEDGQTKIHHNPTNTPHWLKKLHGLAKEFKCEVCGDCSYKGRRAFEKHFKEGQHQNGMRRLGIPNTNSFNEITSIEEAKELWKTIQERQGVSKWRPEVEEEYEDSEGNVYNNKTYSDLQRQGLI